MKEKLDYIERQFKTELDREESLSKKGQIYLSINSIILSTLLFKIKELKELIDLECGLESLVTLVITLLLIFASVFFIALSLKIHSYERPSSSDTMKREMLDNISTDSFLSHRIADLLVAIKRNALVNDKRANRLQISLTLMLVGYGFGLMFLIFVII